MKRFGRKEVKCDPMRRGRGEINGVPKKQANYPIPFIHDNEERCMFTWKTALSRQDRVKVTHTHTHTH